MQLQINGPSIWICTQPVDFRKAIEGLVCVITSLFNRTPSDGIFVFYNRSKDKVKILSWHNNGFILLLKRLEQGRFTVTSTDDQLASLDAKQLSWLLAGLDWVTMSKWGDLEYVDYY